MCAACCVTGASSKFLEWIKQAPVLVVNQATSDSEREEAGQLEHFACFRSFWTLEVCAVADFLVALAESFKCLHRPLRLFRLLLRGRSPAPTIHPSTNLSIWPLIHQASCWRNHNNALSIGLRLQLESS